MSKSSFAPALGAKQIRKMNVAVVRTLWNSHITKPLMEGALAVFAENNIETVETFEVPGAIELTFASNMLIETGKFDVIVVLGCVIRGGTPHFDYVCQSVTQGITHLNAECDVPVIFGVLTVDNEQQALDRIGGPAGHKGREAAEAAIMMFDFTERANNL